MDEETLNETLEHEPPWDPVQTEQWERIVHGILRGDRAAQDELYQVFERPVRFHMSRYLPGQEVTDKIHDTFVTIVSAIVSGQVRDARRLPGFVWTIVHRQVAGYMEDARRSESLDAQTQVAHGQNGLAAERGLLRAEQRQLALRLLRRLPEVDRQILQRFYFAEESPRQICEALGINHTQFRLRKNRAKQRMEEMMQEATQKRDRLKILLRKGASSEH